MKKLVFKNLDAKPKVTVIKCYMTDVPNIMLWYGSHHAGDRYSVTYDEQVVSKDQNGEPINWEGEQ